MGAALPVAHEAPSYLVDDHAKAQFVTGVVEGVRRQFPHLIASNGPLGGPTDVFKESDTSFVSHCTGEHVYNGEFFEDEQRMVIHYNFNTQVACVGCSPFGTVYDDVQRHLDIQAEAMNEQGTDVRLTFSGFLPHHDQDHSDTWDQYDQYQGYQTLLQDQSVEMRRNRHGTWRAVSPERELPSDS